MARLIVNFLKKNLIKITRIRFDDPYKLLSCKYNFNNNFIIQWILYFSFVDQRVQNWKCALIIYTDTEMLYKRKL